MLSLETREDSVNSINGFVLPIGERWRDRKTESGGVTKEELIDAKMEDGSVKDVLKERLVGDWGNVSLQDAEDEESSSVTDARDGGDGKFKLASKFPRAASSFTHTDF